MPPVANDLELNRFPDRERNLGYNVLPLGIDDAVQADDEVSREHSCPRGGRAGLDITHARRLFFDRRLLEVIPI